jgi:hypothetical protein
MKVVPRLGMSISLVCLLTSILAANARADEAVAPNFNPSLNIHKCSQAVKIDGILDDAAWKEASVAGNFIERDPGQNLKPQVETKALITYDKDNLYVGFICYDDPSKIRATICQRDQADGDDHVCFLLDTYGNASWAYEFFVNPYGIQGDRLWSNISGEDAGFDLSWESNGTVTDSGYQIEMAIPFSSLRFPHKDQQTWKIDFWRGHPREIYRQYSWSAYNHNNQCWVCQWGTATGIAGVKPGRGLEILPNVIASQAGNLVQYPDTSYAFHNDDAKAEVSIGGKYSISSDITMEATYNPDFSQVETDAAQIDVNTTISLLYPERRPFFQEGSDIFRTLFNSFYTRTVNDPQFAAKLTGRSGPYSVGFLSAYDENTPYMLPLEESGEIINTGKSTVNALRGTRAIGNDNMLGFIVTDRRFDGGGYGTILSVDGSLRLSDTYSAIAQYIYSLTEEPDDSVGSAYLDGIRFDNDKYTAMLDGESYGGGAMVAQVRRRARNLNVTLNYDFTDPAYRTETGYDPWNDYKNLNCYVSYSIFPGSGIFSQISSQIGTENRWNYDKIRKWSNNFFGMDNNLRWAQTYFNFHFNSGVERWQGVEFDKLWHFEYYAGSQFNDRLGMDIEGSFGREVALWLLEKGKSTSIEASVSLKPIDRVLIETGVSHARSENIKTGEELYKQTISRTRIRYQITKELSMRLVGQYNDRGKRLEIDPLVTYRLNPFSVFYAGSTLNSAKLDYYYRGREEWKQTSRQYFMKLQYLFSI